MEYCVLAVLGRGESYGFELARTLNDKHGMSMSEGTLYPLLARLRGQGLVETTWRPSATGPPRRYYRATAAGTDALGQFVQNWAAFKHSVDDVLFTEGERD